MTNRRAFLRTRALPAGLALVAIGALSAPASGAVSHQGAGPTSWTRSIEWSSSEPAPGVTLRTGVLSTPSAPFWTVTIDATVTSSITGKPANAEVGTAQWADDTAAKLRAAGFTPRLDPIAWPDFSDTPHGLQGVRVRTGEYATQADANAAVTQLRALGFATAAAEWTGYDGDTPADGEQIHVAVIDPSRYRGEVYATHHGDLAQRQKVSAVSGDLGATVAVNGGFFVTADADGYQGAPTGIAAYDGKLESLDNGARSGIVFGAGPTRISRLSASVTVRAGDASQAVNGINRKPGVVRDCGRPGEIPTTQPRQDISCTTTSELVLFTPELGAPLPTGDGVEVVLDGHGVVTAVASGPGARGGTAPATGDVIQGIGAAGDWLAAHATIGQRLTIDEQVRDGGGQVVPLTPHTSIASAAPNLLTNGRTDIDAAAEGVIDPDDLSFNYAWAEIRQPRTMAGIDGTGRLLLVTVDGRQPGVSEGLTLVEEADLLKSLGAVDALNLDGGGSTAIATGPTLLNHTSDATGERADGDFVVAVPRR